MNYLRILLTCSLCLTSSLGLAPKIQAQTTPVMPTEETPMTTEELLTQVCDFLKTQQSMTVEMDITYDNVLTSGSKVQYSGYKTVSVQRPNADNATVRLDLDNQPQPDALLRIKKGGRSRISKDDYIEGAPELIVEIAGSTASYDLHDKLQVYRRHGVKEYIVWQVYSKKIDWFYLHEGKYLTFEPDGEGLIESKVFPGLVLAVDPLLEYNLSKVLSILQKHSLFIQELQ